MNITKNLLRMWAYEIKRSINNIKDNKNSSNTLNADIKENSKCQALTTDNTNKIKDYPLSEFINNLNQSIDNVLNEETLNDSIVKLPLTSQSSKSMTLNEF